jgi:hypothetical protein
MAVRFCLLLLVAVSFLPLRAQDDQPINMHPPFPLAFPLASNGTMVTVKFPVLINPATVVKPGMQLRVLYILNRDSQTGTDLALAHAGSLESSYARNSFGANGSGAQIPPELAHEIEGYRRTVWEVPNNFVLAMAQYPTESMHLIYSPTNSNRDLDDEVFSFFDGLLVGAPGGKVTVLAVEKNSKADAAGVKAGDEIIAEGDYPTRDDLTTFANGYASAKTDAKNNEVESYAMTLRGADGTTRTVQVRLPLRIHSGLMDGFSEKP